MIWDCLIVGGGCAGLAAATALSEAGRRVLVLERRPILGGRASSFFDRSSGEVLDNGQHLFLGCYRETRRYLLRIGSDSLLFFDPCRPIAMAGPDGRRSLLAMLPLPSPLHLLGGILRYGALSWRERFALARVARSASRDPELGGLSVEAWLRRLGQSGKSCERFWDLLTLATLNVDPARAPADLLAVVLTRGFLKSRDDSAVGLSSVGLSELHGDPSRRFIERRGGEIRMGSPVREIWIEGDRVRGVRLADGGGIEARSVISAVPPPAARKMVPATSPLLAGHLAPSAGLLPSPIVSLHLWSPQILFPEPFLGLWGREFHWVFRKSEIDRRARHATLVKSAAESFLSKGRGELTALAERELSPLAPSGNVSIGRSVLCVEREATWVPPLGDSRARLPAATPVCGFFLAGDWTDTGLPATIESAVASGHLAAAGILNGKPLR